MQGLLSVSYGTSHAASRAKAIDAIDAELAAAFPGRAFYRAWTSGRLIAKVRAECGEEHDGLDEAFGRLSADGVTDLVVSTTCLLNGFEMGKIRSAVQAWASEESGRTARLAPPLLSTVDGQKTVACAICDEFSHVASGDALLLMGHGSKLHVNDAYENVRSELRKRGRARFLVATVEGAPTFEDALLQLRACGARRVWLAPLTIVAGNHASNDLAGRGENSWARRLDALGYEVHAVMKGLGEYEAVRALACRHALNAPEVTRAQGAVG